MGNLSKNAKIIMAGSPVAAASDTDDNSSIIDTFGFGGITFIASISDSLDTGVATFTVEQNSANSDTGMTALTGSAVAITSAANDDVNGQIVVIEVERPTERYVQLVRTSTVANMAFGDVIAILDDPAVKPVTADSTVEGSALLVSPAEV